MSRVRNTLVKRAFCGVCPRCAPDAPDACEIAFRCCGLLESVTVPAGLTNIHERAFAGHPKLLDANGKARLTRVLGTAGKAAAVRSAK